MLSFFFNTVVSDTTFLEVLIRISNFLSLFFSFFLFIRNLVTRISCLNQKQIIHSTKMINSEIDFSDEWDENLEDLYEKDLYKEEEDTEVEASEEDDLEGDSKEH